MGAERLGAASCGFGCRHGVAAGPAGLGGGRLRPRPSSSECGGSTRSSPRSASGGQSASGSCCHSCASFPLFQDRGGTGGPWRGPRAGLRVQPHPKTPWQPTQSHRMHHQFSNRQLMLLEYTPPASVHHNTPSGGGPAPTHTRYTKPRSQALGCPGMLVPPITWASHFPHQPVPTPCSSYHHYLPHPVSGKSAMQMFGLQKVDN
ncbi:uncharacterized protein LOC117077144 [Trachypithecus francoisi]|uniref:uncharacterized protein LOC117077144 n=1 Tax=Trachypithecus francoisi TaxID=54180 RepID=UPI00141AE1DA|nr:uncharacterized protein LOC117077144 [Trachypithecus francoisi]